MAQDMQFMRESPFWYFLARRDLERSAQSLARVLESLQHRAAELSLPIHYPREHASLRLIASCIALISCFTVSPSSGVPGSAAAHASSSRPRFRWCPCLVWAT